MRSRRDVYPPKERIARSQCTRASGRRVASDDIQAGPTGSQGRIRDAASGSKTIGASATVIRKRICGKTSRILDIAPSPSRRMRRLVALSDRSGMQTAQANGGGSCGTRKAEMQLRIDLSSLVRASIGALVRRSGIVRIEEPRIIDCPTFGRNGVGRMDQRSSRSDLNATTCRELHAAEREPG